MHRILWAVVFLVSVNAYAETVYVIDRIRVGIYSGVANQEPLLANVVTGEALQVLQKEDGYIRVRTTQGTEGWIDAAYVTTEAPVRQRVDVVRKQLKAARDQVSKLREKLVATQQALSEEKQRVRDLANALEQRMSLVTEERPQAAPEPAPAPATGGGTFLWILAASAMLVVGFVAGMLYIRERYRRRLGGMHLRI